MSYKIEIKRNDGEIVERYSMTVLLLALEQFKQLVAKRIPDCCMYLVEDTTVIFGYDLDPRAADLNRWRSKENPISGKTVMPQWMSLAEIAAQKPEINKMSLYRWKHRFTDGYNRLKKGHAYLYDLHAVEQILNKEEVII